MLPKKVRVECNSIKKRSPICNTKKMVVRVHPEMVLIIKTDTRWRRSHLATCTRKKLKDSTKGVREPRFYPM